MPASPDVNSDGIPDWKQKPTAVLIRLEDTSDTVLGVAVSNSHPVPVKPAPVTPATADVHAPTTNTAAVVTKNAAGAGVSHVVDGIAWSYSADPTNGNLKVEDGSGNTVLTLDVTKGGPGVIYFPRPLKGTANTAMIVTLAAGGSSVSGKVNLIGHRTE